MRLAAPCQITSMGIADGSPKHSRIRLCLFSGHGAIAHQSHPGQICGLGGAAVKKAGNSTTIEKRKSGGGGGGVHGCGGEIHWRDGGDYHCRD